jgi:hypothetical protein
MILALILLIVLIVRPAGITGGKEITDWVRRRKSAPSTKGDSS